MSTNMGLYSDEKSIEVFILLQIRAIMEREDLV